MPNPGPAGAGYVVVGDGVRLLGSEALGDATNNVAEYTAVRNALRAAADAGATSAYVRMDSSVVVGHLTGSFTCAGRAPDPAQGGGRRAEGPVQKGGGQVRSDSQGAERSCRPAREGTARGPRSRKAPIRGDRFLIRSKTGRAVPSGLSTTSERGSPTSAHHRFARIGPAALFARKVRQNTRRSI